MTSEESATITIEFIFRSLKAIGMETTSFGALTSARNQCGAFERVAGREHDRRGERGLADADPDVAHVLEAREQRLDRPLRLARVLQAIERRGDEVLGEAHGVLGLGPRARARLDQDAARRRPRATARAASRK